MNTQRQTLADQIYAMYAMDGYTFTADRRVPDAWAAGVVREAHHYCVFDGRVEPIGESEYMYGDGSILVVRIVVSAGGEVGESVGGYEDIEDDDDDVDWSGIRV